MKHKILIADDSLTIQKVIKITLASEPFELVECTAASDLEKSLNDVKPSIILLDFNLSEDKTGYDLARDIKNILPHSKILTLFGTFDTVDEALLEESGVSHKIVKPFDGTKFINLCRVMADELDMEGAQSISDTEEDFSTNAFPEPIADETFEEVETVEEVAPEVEESAPIEEAEEDMWVVEGNQSFPEEPEPLVEAAAPQAQRNSLTDNMKDWGIDVPGIISTGENNIMGDIPGIIGGEESVPFAAKEEVSTSMPTSTTSDEALMPSDDDLAFPDSDDLAYPDEISASSTDEAEAEEDETKLPDNSELEFPDMGGSDLELEDKPVENSGPQLRTIEIDDEPVVDEIEVSEGGTDTEEALNALKDELKDELEEEDGDNGLWGADVLVEDNSQDSTAAKEDSFEPIESDDLPQVESHKLEKVVDNTEPVETALFDDSFDDVHDLSGPDDFPADVMDETQKPAAKSEPKVETFTAPNVSSGNLEAELREKLTPVVEDFVKQYCRENVEKIAWEIIPDLAENLIKKEIQKISDSIMNP